MRPVAWRSRAGGRGHSNSTPCSLPDASAGVEGAGAGEAANRLPSEPQVNRLGSSFVFLAWRAQHWGAGYRLSSLLLGNYFSHFDMDLLLLPLLLIIREKDQSGPGSRRGEEGSLGWQDREF